MPRLVVFDAYGTLFDVAGAARSAAAEPGGERLAAIWQRLAAEWRAKQLEYTWIRAITGAHVDFETVTGEALDWALEAQGVADPALRDRLMALYRMLPAYGEVPRMLDRLAAAGLRCAILSNGAPAMPAAAFASAGIGGRLEAVISVEAAGIFKPAAAVYRLVEAETGVAPADVLFVSANGWDAAAAAGFGFETVWVNRAGAPQDRLPWGPAHVVRDLSALPALAGERA
ncbi:haloacid dehalogenase type II [soil metagenome]